MRSAKEQSTVGEAIRHPLRARILEVLNERDMEPGDFVKAGYADFFWGHRPDVSHISYHFRELADYGCLEEVAWRKSRGSVATTYRGAARTESERQDSTELSDDEKRATSKTVARGLVARIDGALRTDTFDSRGDRQLSWSVMELDERGWTEAAKVLADAFAAVDRIREDAATRLADTGEVGLTATAGILIFESPGSTSPVEIKRRKSPASEEE